MARRDGVRSGREGDAETKGIRLLGSQSRRSRGQARTRILQDAAFGESLFIFEGDP